MITKETLEMAQELRKILGSIKGIKKVGEEFSLYYALIADSSESKAAAIQVSQILQSQAKAKGLPLEIIVATEDELQIAQDKQIEDLNKSTTFKV